MKKQEPFEIAGETVKPGTAKTVMVPIGLFPDSSAANLAVRVIHGHHPGKRLFISSTMHGDEINGIEAIHRVLKSPKIKYLHGTLVAIPIINMAGAMIRSRYLPDRRDLNRCFPGSTKGSAGAQLAYTFLNEIVKQCTHGIDLHTGSNERINLPQIRCDFKSPEALKLALAFAAPVILKSKLRPGSLRGEAEALHLPTIIFEGGEALRFNPYITQAAVQGIFRVMGFLGMIPPKKVPAAKKASIIAPASRWLRAPATGVFYSERKLGDKVNKGDIIGTVCDSLGVSCVKVVADFDGIIIGKTQFPLVYQGDALFNVAWVPDPSKAAEEIEEYEEEAQYNISMDDPETF